MGGTGNLQDWSAHLIGRLRRQSAGSDDPYLAELAREVSRYPGVGTGLAAEPAGDEISSRSGCGTPDPSSGC